MCQMETANLTDENNLLCHLTVLSVHFFKLICGGRDYVAPVRCE